MSSEGDTPKSVSSETNEKPVTDSTDSSQDVEDSKSAKTAENNVDEDADEKSEEDSPSKDAKSEEPDSKPKPNNKGNAKAPENDVADKKKEKESKSEDEDGENSEKTEEEEEDSEKEEKEEKPEKAGSEKKEKEVPLLDQPLEKSGKRERKNVQRFVTTPSADKDTKVVEIPSGSGTQLGEIPRIDASISRFKNDDLKLLHKILFKTVGKTTLLKKNIRKFNGFDFKKDSEEYDKKLSSIQKNEVKHLKSICEMLDLVKTGNKEEISERILAFLIEPKDSGTGTGGRPRRSAAVKANNRGYSSHDDYSSDEKPSRAKRDKGKRPTLKDESSSESDEEFQPSDGSDEKPRVNKRKRTARKKPKSDDESEDEGEVEPSSPEDSDDEPKNKKKRVPPKANSKAKAKSTSTSKRGRKPAPKSAPAKSSKKKSKETSDEEESGADDVKDGDDGGSSSSEDEPLVKKAKTANPPTDDEIKTYIKEVLEGANLEEITMKNVCQKVYAHYPDFDLTHKKYFIKTTVKSLIST